MDTFPTESQAVYDAVIRGDFEQVKARVEAGAALDIWDTSGESLLECITFAFVESPECACRTTMLRLLLQLGADPNFLSEEGSTALTSAMLGMDSELLLVLLEAGADPNLPPGFFKGDSLYDWALFDYEHNVWIEPFAFRPESAPSREVATPEDQLTDESWLEYLDRCALAHDFWRPDHLVLLRKYGAKTAYELAVLP
jgi:hypothetical protein